MNDKIIPMDYANSCMNIPTRLYNFLNEESISYVCDFEVKGLRFETEEGYKKALDFISSEQPVEPLVAKKPVEPVKTLPKKPSGSLKLF